MHSVLWGNSAETEATQGLLASHALPSASQLELGFSLSLYHKPGSLLKLQLSCGIYKALNPADVLPCRHHLEPCQCCGYWPWLQGSLWYIQSPAKRAGLGQSQKRFVHLLRSTCPYCSCGTGCPVLGWNLAFLLMYPLLSQEVNVLSNCSYVLHPLSHWNNAATAAQHKKLVWFCLTVSAACSQLVWKSCRRSRLMLMFL